MRVVDVGTGGGFPLLPLAMSLPELQFVGIDSVRKKTLAVNEMIQTLGIQNAEAVWTRIEEYQGERFDLLTARAVAYADKLLEWSHSLVKKGGAFLLMKEDKLEEKELLLELVKKYHLQLEKEHHYQLFE